MKSYLDILLPDGTRVYEPNDLFQFEVSRMFRKLVTGATSGKGYMAADPFFRSAHVYSVLRGRYPKLDLVGSDNPAVASLLVWGDVVRFRGRVSNTITNPGYPSQKAFVMSRIYSQTQDLAPIANMSSIDINLRQIGTTYSHAVTSPVQRAFFNVPGDVPFATGTGVVTPTGPFAPTPGEEGHYLYDVRVKDTGDTGVSTYVWRRRPYYQGSYEHGSGRPEAYNVGTYGDVLDARLYHTTNRVNLDIRDLAVSNAAPTPSTVPYTVNYPTAASILANAEVCAVGMCWDGLPDGRIWWANTDDDGNNEGRSVWTWKRMTPEAFQRADADMTTSDPAIVTGWPSFGSTARFRDIKAGRGGYLYLAVDGDDDAGTGTDSLGSVIQIDANAGSMAVLNTWTSVQTGLAVDSVLAVAVDKSESVAAAGYDRVWILTRGGLAYTDVNIATGANPGGWIIAFNAAIIDPPSQRGLGGFTFYYANRHQGLMDVDSQGNVYWISAPVPTAIPSIHRVNKIDAALTTHTFLSLDTSAEVGPPAAAGYLQLGGTPFWNAVYTCSSIKVHRRDPGDPYSDDLWLGAGKRTNGMTTALVQQIPLADPYVATVFTGANPGFAYFYSEFRNENTGSASLHISPDGSVLQTTTATYTTAGTALLESLGRDVLAGVGVSLTSLGAGAFTLVSTLTPFAATDVGKVIHITDTTGNLRDGRYKITAYTSTSTVTVQATTTVTLANDTVAFNWAVDRFDSRGGAAPGTPSTWKNNLISNKVVADAFVDDSGMGYFWCPRDETATGVHVINFMAPIGYQWDSGGAQWYRSRFSTVATSRPKTTHGTTDSLASGISVNFADGAGPINFLAEEYYTWLVSMGIIKDPTQEITWSLDFFSEQTELVLDEATPAMARNATAMPSGLAVGVLEVTPLASVLTTDPFLFEGTGAGAGDSIANISGSTWEITISAAPFSGLVSGGFLTISNAVNYANNGSFLITLVPGTNKIQYTNASAIAEVTFNGDYAASQGPAGLSVTDSPAKQAEVSYHQRRFLHDGTVATQTLDIGWTATTVNTVNGVSYGIKFTADKDVAALRFAFNQLSTSYWDTVAIGLYSSTDAAGPQQWTERAVYRTDEDHPDWTISGDAFHDTSAAIGLGTAPVEIEIDVANLMSGVATSGNAGVGDSITGTAPNMTLNVAAASFDVTMVGRYITIPSATTPGNQGTFPITAVGGAGQITYTNAGGLAEAWTNPVWTYSVGGIAPARYWKIFIYLFSGSFALTQKLVGAVAYDSSGYPIDVPTDNYLTEATSSNYLANMALRGTWVQDKGTGSAARAPATNQATLTADTFEVALTGAGNGTTDSIGTGPPTLTINAGPFNTATVGTLVGRYVTISGASAPENNGTFPIVGNPGSTSVTYTNPYAVAQAAFAGSYSIDGVASADFMRVYVPATVSSILAPVEEIQNFIATASVFVAGDVGRVIEITGATNIVNNGVFQITRVISATEIQYRNAAGVSDATGSGVVYREYTISTVDSPTQLTFTAVADPFSAASWEVVRNADIRPRGNEGGGENQARIPELAGEVFVCPLTGHIWYADIDVVRGREFHMDKYAKVFRSI